MKDQYSVEFLDLWKAYPHKTEKKYAAKCYAKAMKDGAVHEQIIEGVKRYSSWLKDGDSKDWRPNPKNLSTFLNRGCWEDEYEQPEKQAAYRTSAQQRIENFRRTGYWPQDWGDKPVLN